MDNERNRRRMTREAYDQEREQRVVPQKRKRRKKSRKKAHPLYTAAAVITTLAVLVVVLTIRYAIDYFGDRQSVGKDPGGSHDTASVGQIEGYTYIELGNEEQSKGTLILVSNKVTFMRETSLEDFVSLYDSAGRTYNVKDRNVALEQEAADALDGLLAAFREETGIDDIIATSGFRSVETQRELQNGYIATMGEAEARLVSADPYGSEHHTGLAIDLGIYRKDGKSYDFDGTGKYAFITENAPKYGMIKRYEASKRDYTGITDEPWHYRYIGLPHSLIITDLKMCLEEYHDYLREYRFEGEHLIATVDGRDYEIYYYPANDGITEVPVPEAQAYTVSGNNMDGFIVTVELG